MRLFKTYTGSAFLNQVILTLLELTDKPTPADLDTEDILRSFKKPYQSAPFSLANLNRRLKSYTMVFTRNGPLHQDNENGMAVYDALFQSILSQPENSGDKICEISGLRFSTSFEEHYLKALEKVRYTKDKIAKKDLTINRCWFPLIGGLGSDAQALPQASFAVSVHPVCLVVLQFLPLSALLYKGGVLLVDSPNIAFTKSMVSHFVDRVKSEVTAVSGGKAIENIKDFGKGDYIILALEKLSQYEAAHTNPSGFNFWSFSNSGTGANCLIDRIPNNLIRRLQLFFQDYKCVGDLKNILRDPKKSETFLTALNDNQDFWGLYPAKGYIGVGVDFFERYQEMTGNGNRMVYAKYIARLLRKQTLNKDEKKFLSKTDAYAGEHRKRYTGIVGKLLREATEGHLWHPLQQFMLLKDGESVPLSSSISNVYPILHFYYQKLEEDNSEAILPPIPNEPDTAAYAGLKTFLFLLNEDKDERAKKQLMERGYQRVTFNELLWRTGSKHFDLERFYPFLYDKEANQRKSGLRELLHFFLIYHNGNLTALKECTPLPKEETPDAQTNYLERLKAFCGAYFNYYLTFKNNNSKDLSAFRLHVLKPMVASRFQISKWLDDTLENMKKVYSEDSMQLYSFSDKTVFSEALLYDHTGNYNPQFAHFAIAFHLHRLYHQTHKTKQPKNG